MMSKLLMGAAALAVLTMAAGAASAQSYYGPGPRPPYATGVYLGLGFGEPDCSFTIVGAHAGVTVLGINIGGGARVGIPGVGACQDGGSARGAYSQAYAPPPAYPPQGPYYGGQSYGGGGYYNQGGGYPAPVAYSQPIYAPPPPMYGGGYPSPCGC